MQILDQWGISFHPVVVVGLGNNLLFNFLLGHCGQVQVTIIFFGIFGSQLQSTLSFPEYPVGLLFGFTTIYTTFFCNAALTKVNN